MRGLVIIVAVTAVTVLTLTPAAAQDQEQQHENHNADEHAHHHAEADKPTDAPIKITINPEARVSVIRAGELPPAAVCGQAMELSVKIVNQGFVTAPLEATLVDSIPAGVRVEFSAKPLTGMREEHRVLLVTLEKPEYLDITVAFRAKNDIPDLGGRDRIHLLLRCEERRQQG